MTIPPSLTHSLTPLNFNFISAELYHSVIQTHPTVPEKKYESDEKRLNHLEMERAEEFGPRAERSVAASVPSATKRVWFPGLISFL